MTENMNIIEFARDLYGKLNKNLFNDDLPQDMPIVDMAETGYKDGGRHAPIPHRGMFYDDDNKSIVVDVKGIEEYIAGIEGEDVTGGQVIAELMTRAMTIADGWTHGKPYYDPIAGAFTHEYVNDLCEHGINVEEIYMDEDVPGYSLDADFYDVWQICGVANDRLRHEYETLLKDDEKGGIAPIRRKA